GTGGSAREDGVIGGVSARGGEGGAAILLYWKNLPGSSPRPRIRLRLAAPLVLCGCTLPAGRGGSPAPTPAPTPSLQARWVERAGRSGLTLKDVSGSLEHRFIIEAN